jgi:hypothetical protein
MVVQHELQHGETMAQTLALAGLNGQAALHEVEAAGRSTLPAAVHARLGGSVGL